MKESDKKPTIQVAQNGPLLVSGKCEVIGPDGKWLETRQRFALCRCGKSSSKPYCDNTHVVIAFDDGPAGKSRKGGRRDYEGRATNGVERRDLDREPAIRVVKEGPYNIEGGIELKGVDMEADASREHYALCRCGASRNKPFCDGSHRSIDPWDA